MSVFFPRRWGNVASSGGFRSVFMRQIGGLGSPSVVPIPPAGVPSGGVGSGYFSRGQWHLLKKRWREEDEILARAAEAKGRKEREALERAAAETAKARVAVDLAEAEQGAALDRLSSALAAAAGADTVSKAILRANEAVRIAQAIRADIDEEEEAVAFFMLN